jgi:glycine cleavage system transcriptional repressor
MSTFGVLTAVGDDRPGLADEVSKFILDCGCNIEDSRMAVLGGEFAMLILISGSSDCVNKVLSSTEAASAKSKLSIHGKLTRSPRESARADTIPYSIEAYCMDHPGVVQRITHFLAERRINIRSLDTRTSSAPFTGQPLFSLHATIDVPAKENVMDLRRGLEGIGAQENIDIEIKRAQP